MLGIFKKNVRAGIGLVEVQKTQVEETKAEFPEIVGAGESVPIFPPVDRQGLRQAVGRGQSVAAVIVRKEDRDLSDGQGLREAVDDGREQGVEVGLRAESTAELDQRLPVVIALAVEELVDAFLNGALERIEEQRCEDYRGDETARAEGGQALLDEVTGDRDQQEIQPDDGRSRQRVSDAALEDQVDIHQAVTNDGPAEGERQYHKRDTGELLEDPGNRHVGKIGDYI